MDKASVIGVVIGCLCLGIVLFHSSHGHLEMFYSQEGVLMVFGGSISVAFMAMPMSKLKNAGGWIRRFMFYSSRDPVEIVHLLTRLADKARAEGLLALEPDIQQIEKDDAFLASGLRMALDGLSPEAIESRLRLEILAMQERHKAGKKFFDLIKLYGPGYGLVGTLVGQVGMFGNLGSGDIGQMGKMLAIAVVATMYGAILANAIAGPMGDKLGMRSAEEMLIREMSTHGILSIQAGDNPRLTMDKMIAFIPNAARQLLKAA